MSQLSQLEYGHEGRLSVSEFFLYFSNISTLSLLFILIEYGIPSANLGHILQLFVGIQGIFSFFLNIF